MLTVQKYRLVRGDDFEWHVSFIIRFHYDNVDKVFIHLQSPEKQDEIWYGCRFRWRTYRYYIFLIQLIDFIMHLKIITYVLQVFESFCLYNLRYKNLEKLWSSLKVQIWFHKNCECLIPGNHSFHSCIITSIVHIFTFYRKKFILMGFLLVSMCDSVGGTHHESREKLKSSMSTTTTSEKSKQTSKGKSSHSTGGSENSPKRVQSGSVL